jgi:hypothetical protein
MTSIRVWQAVRASAPAPVTFPLFLVSTILFSLSTAQAWEPPIGIPTPPFGISESHTIYTNKTFDYNSNGQLESGEVYKDAGNGPYTHYVDSANSSCTDTNNYGTPVKPLCRIPLSLPAGSVVEVHGRYDVSHDSPRNITARGTAERPVFIRGASSALQPYLSAQFNILGSTYLVVENLEFGDQDGNLGGFNQSGQYISGGTTGGVDIIGPTHHVALRHCHIHGNSDGGGVIVSGGVEDVVVYNNNVHDTGNFQSPDDNPGHGADRGGITVGGQSKRIWAVDNTCTRNGRACVNINPGFYSDGALGNAQIQYVYVGRNVGRENRETNFWTKHASHVIFSQNTASASVEMRNSDHRGNAMGFQYGPENVWFLFNHVYDDGGGIVTQSDSVSNPGKNSYFIGNIVHNIHHGTGAAYNPATAWSGAGIRLSNGGNRYVIGNTIYDVDAGINTPSNNPLYIYDNIISNITVPGSNHIFVEISQSWDIKNCLFYQSGSPAKIRIGTSVYAVPELLALGKGLGSITADPKFVNPSRGDFHISSGSPAVNSALKRSVYDTFQNLYGIDIAKDAEKVARPQGANFDIGAYELSGTQATQIPLAPSGLQVLLR